MSDDDDWDSDGGNAGTVGELSRDVVEKMKMSLSQHNVVGVAGAEVSMTAPPPSTTASTATSHLIKHIDHILFVHPNADAAVSYIIEMTGVTPVLGGRHEGRGTLNHLLSLGSGCFLEIMSLDPLQASLPVDKRYFKLESSHKPFFAWCAKPPSGSDIHSTLNATREARLYSPPLVQEGSRLLPSGETLKWMFSPPNDDKEATFSWLVPFMVEYGNKDLHPSRTAPSGLELIAFSAKHPQATKIKNILETMSIDLDVVKDQEYSVTMRVKTPEKGVVDIRL